MLKFDFNNMMEKYIGREGITDAELAAVGGEAAAAYAKFAAERGTGMTEWADLPYTQDAVVEDILACAEDVKKNFDNFVVLGIGGSALGPIAVFTALCHFRYNDLPAEKRGVKFFVEDNVDPERMLALLDVIDVKRTVFNVITKSGATSETMSQYLIIADILKKAVGKDWNRHIIATTSEKKGNLIKLAKKEGFKTFYIPDGVGGRFSELCPVGLLPAAVLGIDIRGLLAGAAAMDKRCSSDDMEQKPRSCGGGFAVHSHEKGQEHLRHDAVCGFPQIHGGLVLPALGGEPGQGDGPRRQDSARRSDPRQIPRRHGSAFSGAALHRRSL